MAYSPNFDHDPQKDAISLSNQILEAFGNSIGGPQFHVMDKIAEILRKRFHAANCAIFWQTHSPDTLEMIGSANHFWKNPENKVVRIVKSNATRGGFSNWLATLQEPAKMNLQELERSIYTSGVVRESRVDHLGEHNRYSVMFTPLRRGSGSNVGLIKCENKLDEQQRQAPELEFTQLELDLLTLLAVPVAVVGCMRDQAAAQTKEAIERIMRGAAGRKDWQALLHSILDETVRLLGADRGDFAWWSANDKGGGLFYAALSGDKTNDEVTLGNPLPRDSFIQRVFGDFDLDHQLIPDVKKAKRHGIPYLVAHDKIRSELAVRVDLFANPVGVLNVESFTPGFFRLEHVPTLRLLAQQAALAVQQIQRENLVRNSLDQPLMNVAESTVLAVTQAVGSPSGRSPRSDLRPDHSQVVQPVLRGFLESFGFDRGIIYGLDPVGGGLFVAASVHDQDITVDARTFRHSLERGSFARSVFDLPVNSEPIIEGSPGTSDNVDKQALKDWRINGPLLGYPLSFRSQKVGCIVLWCSERRFPRNPPPRARLDQMAILAAARIALWQAEQRLYSDMAFFKALPSDTTLIIFTKRVTEWKSGDRIPEGLKAGDPKFVFDWANPNFLEWVGRSSIIGLTDCDLFPEHAAEYYEVDIGTLRGKPVDGRVEWNVRPRDKERRHVRVWKHLLQYDPAVGHRIQVVFWDRTDTKRIEEEHGALLRDLRHRVYECIHYLHALLEGIAEGQSIKMSTPQAIQECKVRVQAREAVIAALYGRRTGEPIDMRGFIQDIVRCVESCYEHSELKCVVNMPETRFPERIAIACGMIITELVANAFRHGYPDMKPGVVEIALSSDPAEANSWCLQVTDDGIGTFLRPPFNPCAIGLGLVEELVAKHLGGNLTLTSTNPGASPTGLTVAITFSSAKPPPLPPFNPSDPVGKGLVLLVEDNPAMGLRYEAILKDQGYTVLGPIPSVSEVVTIVRDYKPAVVILDVALGGEPYAGLNLAQEIRHVSDVPILFLTMHSFDDEEVQRARAEIQPGDYLQKTSYVAPHLLEKVQSLISLTRPPSTVFICYARERQPECEELCLALQAVCADGPPLSIEKVRLHSSGEESLVTWTDREIRPGTEWQDEISKALKRCAVGVLLIDNHWLASTFIQMREFPELLKKARNESRILPLSVKLDASFIPPKIQAALSTYQFVSHTNDEGSSLDERGTDDHSRRTERGKVWAEIAKRVSEFKEQQPRNRIKHIQT